MSEFRKSIAAVLAFAVCASVAATATAETLTRLPSTSPVAPKGASMKINNVNCPGTADIKVIVWSKEAGLVRIDLERQGLGTVSTGVINVTTSANGGYKGIKTGTVPLVSSPSKSKYRIVATGDGKTRKSAWVKVKSCTLSL